MTDFKPRPGSFAPYLEYMKDYEQREAQKKAVSPLTLLEFLSQRAPQGLPIAELQSLSGMDPTRYRDALKSLRDAGFLTRRSRATHR
jgi:DNA-binding PadR family transcriptional regulator